MVSKLVGFILVSVYVCVALVEIRLGYGMSSWSRDV
jgi:hypothetical protein